MEEVEGWRGGPEALGLFEKGVLNSGARRGQVEAWGTRGAEGGESCDGTGTTVSHVMVLVLQ